jgi:hypothetical protein
MYLSGTMRILKIYIFFCVDEFQRGVSITNFKEKLIYNLKATLKIPKTKKKV